MSTDQPGTSRHLPCDGGCNYGDGPQETCSLHGRPPVEIWAAVEEISGREADLRAQRDAVLALHHAIDDSRPGRRYVHCHCQTGVNQAWPCATARAAGVTA